MTMAKKNPINVTSENFGGLLIQGLEEAVAIEEGRAKPVRVSRRKITARKADVAPPPSYNRVDIVKVRKSLGVSQPVFASMLNVSQSTVRAWEQGAREPEGATLRLLEVADKHPEVLVGAVGTKPVR
jgi:putative transcriptional regulator